MRNRERWIVLALLALAVVVGGRRFLRIADPDASLYAGSPSGR
jgi:hypothetical protein